MQMKIHVNWIMYKFGIECSMYSLVYTIKWGISSSNPQIGSSPTPVKPSCTHHPPVWRALPAATGILARMPDFRPVLSSSRSRPSCHSAPRYFPAAPDRRGYCRTQSPGRYPGSAGGLGCDRCLQRTRNLRWKVAITDRHRTAPLLYGVWLLGRYFGCEGDLTVVRGVPVAHSKG